MRPFLLSLATSESLSCTTPFTVASKLRFPKAHTRFLSSVLVLPNTLQWFCLTTNCGAVGGCLAGLCSFWWHGSLSTGRQHTWLYLS